MKKFIIEQKIRLMVNQYSVFDTDEQGQKRNLIGFAQQKRLAFREKFTIYTNERKENVLFVVQARQVIDFGARYDVLDEQGNSLGVLGKAFKSSLLRSTWHVFRSGDETQPLVIAQERNKTLAIVRRLWEFLPYISEIPFFVKYHFDFTSPETQAIVGSSRKPLCYAIIMSSSSRTAC